ncbi:MAG: YfiR family protein [Bacteroidia bacterium]
MKKRAYILKLKKLLILAVFFCGCIPGKVVAQDVDYKAYTLFVYNFMKYVEWPEAQSKGDFVVAVLGDSPISKELSALASTKKLKGRNIVIKKCNTPEETSGCHLLYISPSKSSSVKILKDQTKDKPVLIVGEREGLAKKGAGLSFVTLDEDELKFDINKKEIETHQLKISSSLLNLGIVVN